MKDECWLKAAIYDDTLVAELLLRLKDSISGGPSSSCSVLPPSWGVRQPRSSVEKKKETPRRSPTTPLSFAASDGCDDSSDHHCRRRLDAAASGAGCSHSSDRFRSKVSVATEAPATTSKRPRRKKTFAELKEEESSLLKERTYLKKELAALRLTFKEQRSINENLKRIKLDLRVESRFKPESNSTEQEERNSNDNGESEAGSSNVLRLVKTEDADSCPATQKGVTSQEPICVLPDLNMMPDEESSVQQGIVGIMS